MSYAKRLKIVPFVVLLTVTCALLGACAVSVWLLTRPEPQDRREILCVVPQTSDSRAPQPECIIRRGMTVDEAEALLGRPNGVGYIGFTTIYTYTYATFRISITFDQHDGAISCSRRDWSMSL